MDNSVCRHKTCFPVFSVVLKGGNSPPHLKNPRPMRRGFFRWGGKFPPFNTVNTGKTGFMPANFVIHNLSSSQLSQISPNSNLKAFWKMFWSTSWDYFIIIILLKVFILEKKSGLLISLNLVSLSLHCFHPET